MFGRDKKNQKKKNKNIITYNGCKYKQLLMKTKIIKVCD